MHFLKPVDARMERSEPPRKSSRRVRAWVFTINNPDKGLFIDGLPDAVRYAVWQRERGKEGTEHFQGYIEFKGPRARTAVAKFQDARERPFEKAWLEEARGSAAANKTYCTKEESRVAGSGNGPWELGECSGGMGARNDLRDACEEVAKSGSLKNVDPVTFVRHFGGLTRLAMKVQAPRRDDLQVVTLVGPTGVGKSYAVRDHYPDVYVPMYGNGGLWFEGYMEQKVVLFEEYRGQMPLQKFLQILDPYPIHVECKGGAYAFHARIIFITSNSYPSTWYENKTGDRDRAAELDALNRRLGCYQGIKKEFIAVNGNSDEDRQILNNLLNNALEDAPNVL